MANNFDYEVLPGGLKDVDPEVIIAGVEQGLSARQIAANLRKHPSTVQWFLYRHGLRAPAYRERKPYMRGGKMVVAFSPDEDAYIQQLRVEGLGCRRIAKAAEERFGNPRNHMTIRTRLVMLANRDEAWVA